MKIPQQIKLISTALVILLALSCTSTKSVIASGKASDKLSAKQIIKQHQKNDADFNTMQAKVKINLIQGTKEQGLTFNFRMEKDKVIWVSAPFGLARMMVTPEKVSFYNKQDNEYFDGDYKLLSDFVGVDLDFMKVQNILLGQAIYDFKAPYSVAINSNSYALQPKDQNTLIELFYLINASHFKMDSLQLYQQFEKRMLQIDYASYQDIDKQILPQNIRVIATEDSDQVEVTLEFKSITLNEEVRFPFNIPSGYKEMIIK